MFCRFLPRITVCILGFLLVGFGGSPSSQGEKNGPSSRHIVIVNADKDFLWASYFLGVLNTDKEDKIIEVEVAIPPEATDFQAQSGMMPEDIKIKEGGKVFVEKSFKTGLNLISIGFKIPVTLYSQQKMTFVFPYQVEEFSVVAAKGSVLNFSSPTMKEGVPAMLANGSYQGILGGPLKEQREYIVSVSGLPQGKGLTWLIAGLAAFLLFSLLFFFLRNSFKTNIAKTNLEGVSC